LDHKYHHYVPQMYLRAFSQNNKSIGGYILSENKYVNNMSIAGICGRKYLYGEDLEVERWFSDLESIWSSIIRKIISSESLELSPDEWTYLYMFIYLSEARTSMAADRLDDIVTKTYKIAALTARNHGKLEMTDDRIRQLQVRGDKPNLPLLKAFPKGIEVIEDLIPVLLINHTSREFITSDNPVLRYNYIMAPGNRTISVGLFGHSGDDEVWTEGTKEMLDDMHKRKIDMANEIFVINVGGYIGSSTRSEIEYAAATGKAVHYLEP